MSHLRMALRWGRERGMLARDQWLDISAIRPLSRHECGGRDRKQAKRAVSTEDIERVAAVTPPVVARMLRVQAAVGMRPGEVTAMRWSNLSPTTVDVDGVACVIYTVAHGKMLKGCRQPPRDGCNSQVPERRCCEANFRRDDAVARGAAGFQRSAQNDRGAQAIHRAAPRVVPA